MTQTKVLLLACVAAFSTGCAVDGTEDSNLAANEADPTSGTLSPDEELSVANNEDGSAGQLTPTAAEGGASGDVRQTEQAQEPNCRDVDLRIISYRGSDTKIRAVQFHSTSDGWVYEDLDDRVLTNGQDHTWTPSLKDARGDHITEWKIKYSYFQGYNNWGVKQWSPDEYSDPIRAAEGNDIICSNGSNFTLTLTNSND